MFNMDELLEKVPHDGDKHTLTLTVRREGFSIIIGDVFLDNEQVEGVLL